MNENKELITLKKAVEKYYAARIACYECTALLLSNGCDPRPPQLMQEMYQAESEMLALAGIDYHGGGPDDK